MKNKQIYIYGVEELAEKMDLSCLRGSILTPEMKVFINKIKNIYYLDEETINTINKAERVSTAVKQFIMRMLHKKWDEKSMSCWKELRILAMKYPTVDEATYKNNLEIKRLYIDSQRKINRYLYAQAGDFKNVVIDFDNDIELFKISSRCKYMDTISEMSERASGLDIMLKYPGLKEYFKENGFTTSFEKNRYLMSPVLFHNIYKGALGEIAGKYILEKEIGIELYDIEQPDKFEFFDFKIAPGVYIDFKNWKSFYVDRNKYKEKISNKLEAINGKKAYIVKVVEEHNPLVKTQIDSKIVEVQGIIDNNGKIIEKNIEFLRGEIISDKNYKDE